MFERIATTKWRLTEEGKQLVGSLLIYMRNEFRAGVSAAEYGIPGQQSNAIDGAATNYKKMMQCIDRILTRLDGTWDAHKLTSAYGIIARALSNSKDGRLARHIINEAENTFGTLALDSIWHRGDSEGNTQLPSPARSGITGTVNGDGSDG